MHQAERGAFDLRRGHVVRVVGDSVAQPGSDCVSNGEAGCEAILVGAAEAMVFAQVAELQELTGQVPRLLLTAQRAVGLGLQIEGGRPVSAAIPEADALPGLLGLSPAMLSGEAIEALSASMRPANAVECAALELAKAARLIPALISAPLHAQPAAALAGQLADGTILSVPARQAARLGASPGLQLVRVTDAQVPLADAPQARFVLFREGNGVLEHVAVLIGEQEQWPDSVAVRLHSACLTGDLFGSLRCDCGEQLRNSVRAIAAQGGGVLLYLAQEGRGIGLANKLRAYTMQDQGLDTVEADLALGFCDDERRYESAVAMLAHLGVERVCLFTNNPEKVAALELGGIAVTTRAALHGSLNQYNRRYLDTKARRSGHMLEALLQPLSTKSK